MEMLILCAFCAIFAQNGPNSRRNSPETAEFAGKMRFFVRKVRKSLAILRFSRYNVPVTER